MIYLLRQTWRIQKQKPLSLWKAAFVSYEAPRAGLEPATNWLTANRSTD
jgi:hypothetical protein